MRTVRVALFDLNAQVVAAAQVPVTSLTLTTTRFRPTERPFASARGQALAVPKRAVWSTDWKLLPFTVPVMPLVPPPSLEEEPPQAAARAATAMRAILRMKSPDAQ